MGRIFYLDAVNGNDENSGITPDAALKSLEAANQILFGAGDKLLLKCGCEWKGMLCPHGDGDRFQFAQIGTYGDGEAPLIDGNGAYAAILLDGVSYWKVKGLRICNVFCIPQETDWQKARYEENIVNASQWLELIQYEIQNPNWRDHVTEKLCKFVGVTI